MGREFQKLADIFVSSHDFHDLLMKTPLSDINGV